MKKINYRECPSFGKNRALFFRDDNHVRVKGVYYPYKSKLSRDVYGDINRMTLCIQKNNLESERMYFYKYTDGWVLENTTIFRKKIR